MTDQTPITVHLNIDHVDVQQLTLVPAASWEEIAEAPLGTRFAFTVSSKVHSQRETL